MTISISATIAIMKYPNVLRAALHLEAGPIQCVRDLKSSLVIGQKVEISLHFFTSRGRVDLVV